MGDIESSDRLLNRAGSGEVVTLLSDPGEIANWIGAKSDIKCDVDATRQLRTYLASIDAKDWSPRIVTVQKNDAIIGFVCVKERKLAGINTGLFFADASGSENMVIAPSSESNHVLASALNYLFDTQKIRGLRLWAPANGDEPGVAAAVAHAKGLDLASLEANYHFRLPLAPTYDAFKKQISKKLRENITRFRNKSAKEGHVFHAAIPFDAFKAAALEMVANKQVRNTLSGVERGLRMASEAERPILAGLRHNNGKEWLGLIVGWHKDDEAWLYGKLNREFEYPGASLGTVTIGNLVESLIDDGQTNSIVFWGGLSGSISRACQPLPTATIYLDQPSPVWRATLKVVAAAIPHMPRRVTRHLDGVVPFKKSLKQKVPITTPTGVSPR